MAQVHQQPPIVPKIPIQNMHNLRQQQQQESNPLLKQHDQNNVMDMIQHMNSESLRNLFLSPKSVKVYDGIANTLQILNTAVTQSEA
jgi:hypothetical protein